MKNIFTLVLLILSCLLNAQTLPYLNASTANINEFPVDADTNIYMFHGNRLVKTDKNFNLIWSNTYSGLNFSNLLLSKTGSIFFIAKNNADAIYFGKLNSDGSVNWIKTTQAVSASLSTTTTPASYTLKLASLLLDRNNDLLLSGDNFLMKTDTFGTTIKLKVFNTIPGSAQMQGLSIICDSAGIYKLAGAGIMALSGGSGISIFSFSDITNTFTSIKNHHTGNYQGFSWSFTRSRFSNGFYARLQGYSIPTSIPINQLAKFDISGNLKWFKAISNTQMNPGQIAFHVNESNNGDLFYALGTYNSNILYTSAFLKLDSNGVGNNFQTKMLSSYNIGTFYSIPSHAPRSIHNGNYYFDVSGYSFPTNPLTVQKFGSALTYSCSNNITDNSTNAAPTFTQAMVTPTIHPITSFTLSNFSTTVAPVTFSVNPNFCLISGVNDKSVTKHEVIIAPNPVQNNLQVKLSNNAIADVIEITDVNGKLISKNYSATEIDVNELTSGIYFLSIQTGNMILRKKFLKE